MAKLGVRTVDELVGRTDLLKKKDQISNERAKKVDFSAILGNPYVGGKVAGYDKSWFMTSSWIKPLTRRLF